MFQLSARLRILFAATLWLAALAGVSTRARAETGQDYATQTGARLLGQIAPAVKLTTIDGQTIDLAALRGHKAVYLKFWATWCVPCREQMPHFEKTWHGAGDDLAVVAINIGFDDTLEQIKAYRQDMHITMPIVRDDDGRIGELFGLRVTPQHVIIAKDGHIAYVGHLADAKLDDALAQARHANSADLKTADHAIASPGALHTGDAAPRVDAKTLDGKIVALADPAHQRRSVLAFLSPWCESYFEKTRPESSRQCRMLSEMLAAVANDAPQRWIGIASGLWASEQDLRAYRDKHHIAVPLTLDRDGSLFLRFGVRRVPALIVIDGAGRIERTLDIDSLKNRSIAEALDATPARQ